ncbi:glutathione S-transferase family protein [uncultured Tateyamaria sp.]|uniref:glutathione S-transferase family protein n=1 Tax=Tateyamaria sp. 1078 TaxID=3417464 RepID=UPI00261F5066|nr:glutathione S-transferase family protein [uncultured Tateyamaria sp.]
MPQLTLFVSPGTCARVPTIALEEIGVPFKTELLRVMLNQQNAPEFLAINPKGKVPTLLIDGAPLTENVAILTWLHHAYPSAGLLPAVDDPLAVSRQVADIAFFSSTVHPTVTRIAMPIKFIDDSALSFDIVRPKGVEAMHTIMRMIEDRLNPWWYGDTWSIVDGYLFWVWWRITGVGFPAEDYPNLRAHAERSMDRPAIQRAMAREAEHVEILKAEGNYRAPR